MYSIWTTIYGIDVPKELNEKLQRTEVSEMFMEIGQGDLPEGFDCDTPYSGDGLADVHLGIVLDSTESRSRKVVSEPTDEQRESFKDGLEKLKVFLDNEAQSWEDEGYPMDSDQQEVFDAFKKLLDEAEPTVYRAYSTS